MSTGPVDHIDDELWRRFDAGDCAAAEAEKVCRHLAECPSCTARLIDISDTSHGEPTAASLPAPLEPGAAVGRYRILQIIGSGGMATVYAAYDPELDRKIALKLLRGSPHDRGDTWQLRLVREAQAMARMSHPNVVAIHDVGTHVSGEVYVAMEFIDGSTLREWARSTQPSQREAISRMAAAARGLAAAHRAGLVHRDFKPDNVLVGRDGAVLVADFGLARTFDTADGDTVATLPPPGRAAPTTDQARRRALTRVGPTSAPAPAPVVPEPAPAPASVVTKPAQLSGAPEPTPVPEPAPALDVPLTRVGTVLGTPGYMAPEQYDAGAIDARTDQFAFCASLYELLYGVRPFIGKTAGEIETAVRAGARRPPPEIVVPGRIRQLMARGLSVDPARRYPTMEALLIDLEHDPRARRRQLLAAVVAAVLLSVAIAVPFAMRKDRSLMCRGGGERVAPLWSAARKKRIRARFAASGVPGAEGTFQLVAQRLDDYLAGWEKMFRESCEATRMRGEQSEELQTLRGACLDQRLERVKALGELLEAADRQAVLHVSDVANALPGLEICADAAALRMPVPLPAGDAARTRIRAEEAELARTETLLQAGSLKIALPRAHADVAASEPTAYPPLQARARVALARTEFAAGDLKAAHADAVDAFLLALRSHAPELQLAALNTAIIASYRLDSRAESEQWRRVARAVLESSPHSVAVEIDLLNTQSSGKEAERDFEHAYILAERHQLFGAMATSLKNLGVMEYRRGQLAEAGRELERAIDLQIREGGPLHPDVPNLRVDLALVLWDRHQFEAALAMTKSATALRRELSGQESDLNIAAGLENGAELELILGRLDEAERDARAALRTFAAAIGPHTSHDGEPLRILAMARFGHGDAAEALRLLGASREVLEQGIGTMTDPAALINTLIATGRVLLATQRSAGARTVLERARQLSAQQDLRERSAEARFLLALTYDANPLSRARSLDAARGARQELAVIADPDPRLVAEMDAWLGRRTASRLVTGESDLGVSRSPHRQQ